MSTLEAASARALFYDFQTRQFLETSDLVKLAAFRDASRMAEVTGSECWEHLFQQSKSQ